MGKLMNRTRCAARILLVAVLLAWQSPVRAEEVPGQLLGSVFDKDTGTPVPGVAVTLTSPTIANHAAPAPRVATTDEQGAFSFADLPSGLHALQFAKTGYAEVTLPRVEVRSGQESRADTKVERLNSAKVLVPEGLIDVEEIEVTASAVDQDASRDQSDQQIDTMSADQLSSFSIPDVAAGLRFVPGVNVVDGQFAVIRGLDDRYNSTLFNSAPIPSPDPDTQSVQLDLFPSDVVSDLVIAKTFSPDLPGNSSGGAVNIITSGASDEEFQLKLTAGGGFNEKAADRFVDFKSGSPVGEDIDSRDTAESEFGASLHGSGVFMDREIRYKGVATWEVDFDSKLGTQEGREPDRVDYLNRLPGDLASGAMSLSNGRFDLTDSKRTEQGTGYFGLGMALDGEGNHNVDASVFYTRKDEEAVQLKEDGYIPGFDYNRFVGAVEVNPYEFDGSATLSSWIARSVRQAPADAPQRGPLWFTNFAESKSFERDRDLIVTQLNGDHWISAFEGLHVGWAANHARTNQDDGGRGIRYFFEPDNIDQVPATFPGPVESLGSGQSAVRNGIFLSANDVRETQSFARLDADWETDVSSNMTLKLTSGAYLEEAKRDVSSMFLETPVFEGRTTFAILGETPLALGKKVFDTLDGGRGQDSDLQGVRSTGTEGERNIWSWNLGAKATFWEQVDLLGGYRFERIQIDSDNDPYTGETAILDGTPEIFPNKWLFLDRIDSPREGIPNRAPGLTYNDQLLGIRVPLDPATGLVDLPDRAAIDSMVDGKIHERRALPSVAVTYRPEFDALLGLTLRGAFSETVARPSFRELGYYVTVEPGTDDFIVGNPQLGLSDVESWDARAEYAWNDADLFALSLFRKTIEAPIESMVLRDPRVADGSANYYRTFFNNPDDASLDGVEVEARKNLGFLGSDFASFFTLGGNYTFIDAAVDRSDVEIQRASTFFQSLTPDIPRAYTGLESSRRLFNQPEWIANLNLSFEQPDWGTNMTLAFYAISDVLRTAGTATIGPDGTVYSFTPDRYVDSYNQLDLVISQTWKGAVFKLSVKNLTDSTRRVIYDPDQTRGTIEERSFKVGRDLAFTVSYAF